MKLNAKKVAVFLLLVILLSLPFTSATSLSKPLLLAPVSEEDLCSGQIIKVMASDDSKIKTFGIPKGCEGRTIELNLFTESYPSEPYSISTSIKDQEAMFYPKINIKDIKNVFVRINDVHAPTMWINNPSTLKAITSSPLSAELTVKSVWTQPNPYQYCIATSVSTLNGMPVEWAVNFPNTNSPFNRDIDFFHYEINPGYEIDSSSLHEGYIVVRGNTSETKSVSRTNPQSFTICNYKTPSPDIDPTASYYQVTSIVQEPGALPCKNVSITVEDTDFYVGWSTTVDLGDLDKTIWGQESKLQGPYGGFKVEQLTDTIYKISGNSWNTNAVHTEHPVKFNACWG